MDDGGESKQAVRYYAAGEEGNEEVFNVLREDGPCLIGRIGGFEQSAAMWFAGYELDINFLGGEALRHDENGDIAFPDRIAEYLNFNAGVFPKTNAVLSRYCRETVSLCERDLDVIGCFDWAENPPISVLSADSEKRFCRERLRAGCGKVFKGVITAPYFSKNPWTRYLKHKKVLVIHPFEDSIRKQYPKREKLFSGYPCKVCMPEFELMTLKPVMSSGGIVPDEYADWFEALDGMKQKISALDFDVALVGAGAYGMHLAKHCKDMGKKAVCMASGVQMSFGVYGERWVRPGVFLRELNEHWVRPMPHEQYNLRHIEEGCYI